MAYQPSPKQALLLWRMITAQTDEARSPLRSETRPKLSPKERESLVVHRFVTLEEQPGKRGKRLVLTDEAWAWAESALDVELLKSNSTVGAEALERLLHRLLPFLQQRDIPLAALFSATPGSERAVRGLEAPQRESSDARANTGLDTQIEEACLALAAGSKKTRVRISALRRRLSSVERSALDHALLTLQDEGRLVLYRDDNSAALTEEDHQAALSVGGAPRHLVYLEA